ncbi:hypothetical protein BH10BDE1_BH10BDE1_21230 [soil metagenome]
MKLAPFTWRRVFVLALVVKILLAAIIPLSNDEAYYWVWSHHLQWSYYDHPAAVAWLFWLGHLFEPLRHLFPGHDLTGVVRIPAVIIGHLSLLVFKKIVGDSISEKQHVQWLIVVLLSPFFGIGSLIVTPDIPLILTWSLSLLAFKRYIEAPGAKTAALLGAALGAGFCSKYHIVLFVPVAIAYVVWKQQWRLFRPASLLSVIVMGLICSAPVWGWNAAHDWISFKFQLNHGLAHEATSLDKMLQQFGDYSGAQLALLSPLVVFTFWKFSEPKELRFLRWFGWGPILFFAYTSLRSPVEANWPIASHLPLLVLASINDTKKYLSRFMISLWTVVSLIAVYQGLNPERDLFGVPAKDLKTHEFVRFRDLEAEAEKNSTLFASSYQMAGALSIATNRTVPKLAGLNRLDFFDYDASGYPTTTAFTVALNEAWPWPAWIAARGFAESSRRTVGSFTLVTFTTTNDSTKAAP